MSLRLGVIVEGQGDQKAVPPLIRKLCMERAVYDVSVSEPFRVRRGRFAPKFDDFERALQFLARSNDEIVVVLDADDDCPVELATNLNERAFASVSHIRTAVVVAHMEYEAWLLAGIESIRGIKGVKATAECPTDLDSLRSAKSRFENELESGSYSETVDQVKYSLLIDTELARKNSRSFDKFVREIERMCTQTSNNPS